MLVNWFRMAGRVLGMSVRPVDVNGGPGALYLDAQQRLIAVVALEIADGQITGISSVVNPDKLAHLGPGRGPHLAAAVGEGPPPLTLGWRQSARWDTTLTTVPLGSRSMKRRTPHSSSRSAVDDLEAQLLGLRVHGVDVRHADGDARRGHVAVADDVHLDGGVGR